MTAVPSTFTDRIASRVTWIGSAAAAWTRTSAPATSRRASAASRTSPCELLDLPVEQGIVERREVEDAHLVPVADQASGEVQAEEARAAGDRDEHGAER